VLPRWANAMPLCNTEKVRVYVSDNTGASATAEWLACSTVLWAIENALHDTLVMVATVAIVMTMAIMVVAATET